MKNIFYIFAIFLFINNCLAEEKIKLNKQDWTFQGIFGRYDNSSLQRGLQIYQEDCSTCHGMKSLRFREL